MSFVLKYKKNILDLLNKKLMERRLSYNKFDKQNLSSSNETKFQSSSPNQINFSRIITNTKQFLIKRKNEANYKYEKIILPSLPMTRNRHLDSFIRKKTKQWRSSDNYKIKLNNLISTSRNQTNNNNKRNKIIISSKTSQLIKSLLSINRFKYCKFQTNEKKNLFNNLQKSYDRIKELKTRNEIPEPSKFLFNIFDGMFS